MFGSGFIAVECRRVIQGAAVQNRQKETLIVKRFLQLFEWLISYSKDRLRLFYFFVIIKYNFGLRFL